MKIPYDDGIKYLILAAVLLSIAWVFNQGQVSPTRESVPPLREDPPVAALFAVAGLGCGVLGVIKIIREFNSK